MIAFSFTNLAPQALLAASTTFTEADATVGLRHPERPHLRGYTTDLSGGRITLDWGAAAALDVLALVHANFTSATVQGHSADTWGAPAYTSGPLTIAPALNDRYQHAHRPVPFLQRFASVQVPTGPTTDGATRFAVGGIWAGSLVVPPQEILFELEEAKLEARTDVQTEDGRTLQRVLLDDPTAQVEMRRRAYNETELAAWRAIDAQWSAAPEQTALVLFRGSHPAECFVMRQTSVSRWSRRGAYNESALTLLEVTAG